MARRLVVVSSLVVALCLTSLAILLALRLQEATSAPAWRVGDRWVYRETFPSLPEPTIWQSSLEVVGTETLNVNGTQVPSYRTLHQSESEPYLDGGFVWYRMSDLAEVRLISAGGEIGWTYDPPFARLKFPLETGTTRDVVSTVRYVGGNATMALSERIQVSDLEEVEVPAGAFSAYEIYAFPPSDDRYYFSLSAANYVKVEWSPGHESVLVETTHVPPEPPSLVPFLVVGSIVVAIPVVTFVLWRRERPTRDEGHDQRQ